MTSTALIILILGLQSWLLGIYCRGTNTATTGSRRKTPWLC